MFILSKPKAISIHFLKNKKEVNDLMLTYGKIENRYYKGKTYKGFSPHGRQSELDIMYVFNAEKYRRKNSVNRDSHWKVWVYKLELDRFSSIQQYKRHFLAVM